MYVTYNDICYIPFLSNSYHVQHGLLKSESIPHCETLHRENNSSLSSQIVNPHLSRTVQDLKKKKKTFIVYFIFLYILRLCGLFNFKTALFIYLFIRFRTLISTSMYISVHCLEIYRGVLHSREFPGEMPPQLEISTRQLGVIFSSSQFLPCLQVGNDIIATCK